MNKIKRLILFIYASYVILLRMLKLSFVCYVPIKKDICILYWFGSLGNNIIQLVHAEYLSEQFGFVIHTPRHIFLNLEKQYLLHAIEPKQLRQKAYFPQASTAIFRDLQIQPDTFEHTKLTLIRTLYYRVDILPFSPSLEDYRRLLRQKLLPIIPHHTDPQIKNNTLVIHIRSGDVFDDNPATFHEGYIQPPSSFYLKVIEKYGFKDIVIVTQNDLKNPCISHLKKLIPGIRIQASDLPTDVSTILSARNLIIAHSTFSLCLGLASDNIKRIFIPQFDITKRFYNNRSHFWPNVYRDAFVGSASCSHCYNLDCDLYFMKILNYVPIGGWHNDLQQNNFMLEHSCEQILLK